MNLLAIPALTNLIIKTWLIWYSRKSIISVNRLLGTVLVCFLIVNIAELLSFSAHEPSVANIIVRLYWSALLTGVLCFAFLAIYKALAWKINIYAYVMLLLFLLLICLTDLFIVGAEPLNGSITRIQGAYYSFMPLTIVLLSIATIVLLGHAGLRSDNKKTRQEATYLFIGYLPVVMSFILVASMMSVGININGLAVIPSAMTWFVAVIILCEMHTSVFKLVTIGTPTAGYVIAKTITLLFNLLCNKQVDLKEWYEDIRGVCIVFSWEMNQYNAEKTADLLNLGVSTVYRKNRQK